MTPTSAPVSSGLRGEREIQMEMHEPDASVRSRSTGGRARLRGIVLAVVLSALTCAVEAAAQTQVNWAITGVETSLGSPLDEVRIGETVTIRSRVRNPANEPIIEFLSAYAGYDDGILDFAGGDVVPGVFFSLCTESGCFGGLTNQESSPLVEVVFGGPYVIVLRAQSLTPIANAGDLDPGLDGVEGSAQFEVAFRALAPGSTTVTVGGNPTVNGPPSVGFEGGGVAAAITDAVTITVVERPCDDGLDDDGDGLVDLQDPGCADAVDPSEVHLRPGDYVATNSDRGDVVAFDPRTTRLTPIATPGALVEPWDVLVEPSGELLITDASQDALLIVDPGSGAATSLSAGGSMSVPTGLARDAGGTLLVAQNLSDVILAVDPVTGGQTAILSDPSITDVDDLLVDPADGSLLVSDPTNGLFRVTDPLGTPGVLPIATGTVQQSRQIVFDGSADLIVADDVLSAPVRLDPSTGSETPLVPGAPFSSLQGAAAEPSGLFLFTDFATGEIVRIDDVGDTVRALNVGRADPGLRHLAVVPTPAELTLELTDALIVDGGTLGVADPGDTLQLYAVVTNVGSDTADLLSLESGLDPFLTLEAGRLTTTQGTIVEGSLAGDPRVEVDLGLLAPGASATVRWEAVVSDPAPARSVTANAWIRREKLILAESDDPSTGPRPDPNVIGVGDYGIVVQAITKVSDTRGGLSGPGNPGSVLGPGALFGGSVEPIGDVDGDGITDVAVGAYQEAVGGGPNFGAFFILLLNEDGTVKERFRWDANSPDLTIALLSLGFGLGDDNLGSSIAYLGDLDGAGPSDFALAVGAWYDDGLGGTDEGALYVLFMSESPLQVLSATKIGDGFGGFPSGQLSDFDYFGMDIENVGDIDGDGVVDLAVGAHLDDTIGTDSGGVWILFLTPNGTVKTSPPLQILVSPAAPGDYLGLGIAALGDFDGDTVPDIAVSATRRDVGGPDRGAVWVLTLNANGTIKTQTEISPGVGGLPSDLLEDDDRFGNDLEVLPDLDGDGTPELVVGASRDRDAGDRAGAVYLLYLQASGAVKRALQLAPGPGVLLNELRDEDRLGLAIAPLGDLDANGSPEIAVGAPLDNDGATNAGAFYVLHTATPVPEPGFSIGLVCGLALCLRLKASERDRRRRAERSCLIPFISFLGLVATTQALAADGVREINQTCATSTGCFAGDAAGFPVTIVGGGSYRLTGNLAVPAGVDAIAVATSYVTLDLNGFEIAGTGICTGSGVGLSCGGGSGDGISAPGSPVGITIGNGTVRNMPEVGINLAGQGHRVHSTLLRHNGSYGVAVDFRSSCSACTALENGVGGLRLNSGGIVERSIASGNGGNGIEIAGLGQGGIVTESTSQFNAGAGVSILNGGVVIGTATYGNAGNGIESTGIGATIAATASTGNESAGVVLTPGSSLVASASRGNAGDGVTGASNVLVNAVASSGNNGHGLDLGDGAAAFQANASANAESGIRAGDGAVLLGVAARGNNGSGIVGGDGSVAAASSANANGGDGFELASHATVSIASAVDNGDLATEDGIDVQHGVISVASAGQNGGAGARVGDGAVHGLASRDAGTASAGGNPDSLICGSCAITGSSVEGQVTTISGVTWASAIRQANGICGASTFTGPEMAVGAAHVCGSSPVVGNASLRIGCTRDPSLGLICP